MMTEVKLKQLNELLETIKNHERAISKFKNEFEGDPVFEIGFPCSGSHTRIAPIHGELYKKAEALFTLAIMKDEKELSSLITSFEKEILP